MTAFIAIDFETADYRADSACAIGLARVEDGRLVDTRYQLIRPPRRDFRFTWVHGLTWADVADAPDFAEAWQAVKPLMKGARAIVAHNAGFDRSVLRAGCAAAGLGPPRLPFICTMRLARALWDVRPTKLPDVCRYLAISLRHHHAESDARACAEIAIAAIEDGRGLASGRLAPPQPPAWATSP